LIKGEGGRKRKKILKYNYFNSKNINSIKDLDYL